MVKTGTSGASRFLLLSLAAVCAVVFSMLVSMSAARAGAEQETRGIKAHNVPGGEYGCNANEWHFVINGVVDEAHAPASITVAWGDGSIVEVIPRSNFTGGVAHYTTTLHLDLPVVAADATIYVDWDGNFNLSHGPCQFTDTPTPTEEVPTETPTEVIETPTEEIPTETPTEEIDTPTATGTVGGGDEETPTVGITETAKGEEETPVPTATTAPTEPTDPTATSEPVEELPNTGANPGSNGTSGMLAAALLAIVLVGAGLMLRRRSTNAGR